MSFDPATTGDAPISWGQAPGPSGQPGPAQPADEVIRRLGFSPEDIGTASWLPDDPDGLSNELLKDGRDFNGAFVPLVIHDPVLAERSYDAAEWAAELIAGEGGAYLCVAPFAEQNWASGSPLSPRQWNHTAAMMERLDELCSKNRLQALVSDVVGGREVRKEGGLDPQRPIHFVLDAGSFLTDGFVPVRLISPERTEAEGDTPLGEMLRGLLRNRS